MLQMYPNTVDAPAILSCKIAIFIDKIQNMKNTAAALVALLMASCSTTSDPRVTAQDYFPPNSGAMWQQISLQELGWNAAAATELANYLEQKNTKAFIILVDGKIAIENYFNGHSATSPWYWASAGKTLTTAVTGIAEQEGLLDRSDLVSHHLGTGWTSAPQEKENLITVTNLLSMNSGLDDTLGDDVSPANLQYVADAGTRWAYHNVYVKLQDVVAEASGQAFGAYFNAKLRDRIGMSGTWISNGGLQVYWSNARSMARFGLLMQRNGKWQDEVIVNPEYLADTTQSSQALNPAYGYMWWLNGKSSYMLPQTQFTFSGPIIPTAPSDMYAAMGKNDQKIYVVPSKKMVVIRMGNTADGSNFALSDFDEVLWEKISALYE